MKVLWIQASNSGIAYWRLYNFWKAAHRNAEFDSWVMWWQKDLSHYHPWQDHIVSDDALKKYGVLEEMNGMIANHDVIVWQSIHTPAALELFYAAKDAYPTKPMLVEIDDNMLSTPEYNPASEAYRPGSLHTSLVIDQIKAADGMIVSTPHLKEVYSEYCDQIYVVPNCIDFQDWGNDRKKKPGIRIGWAGGASHDLDLEQIRGVVTRTLEKHKNVKFVFVHGVPQWLKDIEGVEVVKKFARIDKYPKFIAQQGFDIGLAPLVDNNFNRGKSNLRWLEYSSMGIPTVASNVGHFAETIQDGVDGYLADDEKDFEHKLDLLITDRKLRRKMGRAAQSRVMRDFNVDGVVKAYREALEKALEVGASRPAEVV